MPFFFQIEPQEIAENSFWVKAEEDKFENPELFAKLALTFGTQMKGTCFDFCIMLLLSLKLCNDSLSYALCNTMEFI